MKLKLDIDDGFPEPDLATETSIVVQQNVQARPVTRSSILKTVEFVVRHLVFSKIQMRDIDYHQVYADGLLYGSYSGISPISPSSNRDPAIREALYISLQSAFQLDGSLLIEICQDLIIEEQPSRNKLSDW
jgi:hypothetical protein